MEKPREATTEDANKLIRKVSLYWGEKWQKLAEFDPPIRLAEAEPIIANLKRDFTTNYSK